jgi:hypothetical protein
MSSAKTRCFSCFSSQAPDRQRQLATHFQKEDRPVPEFLLTGRVYLYTVYSENHPAAWLERMAGRLKEKAGVQPQQYYIPFGINVFPAPYLSRPPAPKESFLASNRLFRP